MAKLYLFLKNHRILQLKENSEIIKLIPWLYPGANGSLENLAEMHKIILPGNHSWLA